MANQVCFILEALQATVQIDMKVCMLKAAGLQARVALMMLRIDPTLMLSRYP